MKASEIISELFASADGFDYSRTCDTCKSGDPDREVTKIAVAMFATPSLVRRAAAWGAGLLIVHEPTYYDHMVAHEDEKIENAKRSLIEESGLVIWRYHDHAHRTSPDTICAGELKALDLDGEVSYPAGAFDKVRVRLEKPMTPRELAARMEEKLGIAHVRICGAADTPCTKVTGMFGTPGGTFQELKSDDCEILMTGEACEWMLGEYARDAAELGYAKALLIMGHIGSERDGMVLTAERLSKRYPELEVKYFEGGEVYTYTDRA